MFVLCPQYGIILFCYCINYTICHSKLIVFANFCSIDRQICIKIYYMPLLHMGYCIYCLIFIQFKYELFKHFINNYRRD